MNSNDNARTSPEVVELGVASVETKGILVKGEPMGGPATPGISEE